MLATESNSILELIYGCKAHVTELLLVPAKRQLTEFELNWIIFLTGNSPDPKIDSRKSSTRPKRPEGRRPVEPVLMSLNKEQNNA